MGGKKSKDLPSGRERSWGLMQPWSPDSGWHHSLPDPRNWTRFRSLQFVSGSHPCPTPVYSPGQCSRLHAETPLPVSGGTEWYSTHSKAWRPWYLGGSECETGRGLRTLERKKTQEPSTRSPKGDSPGLPGSRAPSLSVGISSSETFWGPEAPDTTVGKKNLVRPRKEGGKRVRPGRA